MRLDVIRHNLSLPRQADHIGDRRSFGSTMSTDDEGGGGVGASSAAKVSALASDPVAVVTASSPLRASRRRPSPSPSPLRTMLVTANVGSVFEDPELLVPSWQRQTLDALRDKRPHFVAIHFQEVGGKNVQSGMVATVEEFARELVTRAADLGFSKYLAYFDQDFGNAERFTALGSLYLAHETLRDADVQIYDFKTKTFRPFRCAQIRMDTSSASTSSSATSSVEKRKFPLHLFPDGRYSRKGFLRARFRLRGTQVDLVNVHLFHDASNLVSVEAAPSVYSDYRRRALRHVLDHLESDVDGHGRRPFFVFGDFNFRLEGKAVLKKLTRGLSRVEGGGSASANSLLSEGGGDGAGASSSSIAPPTSSAEVGNASADCLHFVDDDSEEVVLRVSKKEFRLSRPSLSETFSRRWEQWRRYDRELNAGDTGARLAELELNFPPTYPYVEDGGAATDYMETRVPAWCDRVLMSHAARDLIVAGRGDGDSDGEDDEDDVGLSMGVAGSPISSSAEYNMIGRDVCMGDHKPVFLRFRMAARGDLDNDDEGENRGSIPAAAVPVIREIGLPPCPPSERNCRPRVESPTYTDLLSGGGGGGAGDHKGCSTRYSADVAAGGGGGGSNHVKMFKETTV